MAGADDFFVALKNQVEGIANLKKPHPLTFDLALMTSKKLISRNEKIELQDLINVESTDVRKKIIDMSVSFTNDDEFERQLALYPNLTSKLLGLILPLVAYGEEPYQHELFKSVMTRIASLPTVGGATALIQLRKYPALLTVYSAGIVAIANQRYDWIKTILMHKGRYHSSDRDLIHLVQELYGINVFEHTSKQLPGTVTNAYTPISDFLFSVLRPFLTTLLPTDEEYRDAFDLFEWILSLLYIGKGQHYLEPWAPVGCYAWRSEFKALIENYISEGSSLREEWPLIKNCFDGEIDQFKQSLSSLDAFLRTTRIRRLNAFGPLIAVYDPSFNLP